MNFGEVISSAIFFGRWRKVFGYDVYDLTSCLKHHFWEGREDVGDEGKS